MSDTLLIVARLASQRQVPQVSRGASCTLWPYVFNGRICLPLQGDHECRAAVDAASNVV